MLCQQQSSSSPRCPYQEYVHASAEPLFRMRRNYVRYDTTPVGQLNASQSTRDRLQQHRSRRHTPKTMGEGGSQVYHAPPASADAADSEISGEHAVLAKNTSLFSRCFLAKPLSVVHAEECEGVLERSLGFWDLFALGFGGTVGRCVCCASRPFLSFARASVALQQRLNMPCLVKAEMLRSFLADQSQRTFPRFHVSTTLIKSTASTYRYS